MKCCPYCGWEFDQTNALTPSHYYPSYGLECPGAEQAPRNPESDKRPLWKDTKMEFSTPIMFIDQTVRVFSIDAKERYNPIRLQFAGITLAMTLSQACEVVHLLKSEIDRADKATVIPESIAEAGLKVQEIWQ